MGRDPRNLGLSLVPATPPLLYKKTQPGHAPLFSRRGGREGGVEDSRSRVTTTATRCRCRRATSAADAVTPSSAAPVNSDEFDDARLLLRFVRSYSARPRPRSLGIEPVQILTSSRASESSQMAALEPAAFMSSQLVGYEVPQDFGGCNCRKSRCLNRYCACFKESQMCTLECDCNECANLYGIRGSYSNSEKKKAVPRPAASLLTGLEVPENFMGCKCRAIKCVNAKCACSKMSYPCTSKCRCRSCSNRFGIRGSSTEPGQGGTGGASKVPDDTTPPTNVETEQADTSSMAREPPQVQDQSRGNKDFTLNELPSPNTESGQADGHTEPGQGGTAGTSNVPDDTTPPTNIETEQADTSSMAREPPQVQDESRGNKDFDLNELPSQNTEPGQADGDTEPGQGGTAGASNVPDETTPAPNIETEQADDTSSMAREPPQVEEQSGDNGGFESNKRT